MDTSKPLIRAKRRVFGPARPTWSEDLEAIVTVMRYGANVSVLLPLAIQRAIIDPKRPDSPVVRATTIVEGMLGKRFFAETVLADQAWIHEPKKTVAQALDEEGLKLLAFERYALAE